MDYATLDVAMAKLVWSRRWWFHRCHITSKLNLEMGGAQVSTLWYALGKEAKQVYNKDKEKTGMAMGEVEQFFCT